MEGPGRIKVGDRRNKTVYAKSLRRLPIREKYIRQIAQGNMIKGEKGQIKMAPMCIEGFNEERPYFGKWTNLRARRVQIKRS